MIAEPARDVLDGLLRTGVITQPQYDDALLLVNDRHEERKRYSADFHPKRRAGDRLPGWVGGVWRNLVPLIALGLAVYAVAGLQSDFDRQAQGRRVAVDVLCGGFAGVAEAGARVLRGDLPGQRGQGLPEVTITAYRREIAVAVIRQAGIDAKGVIRTDGTVDCDVLRVRAAATGDA